MQKWKLQLRLREGESSIEKQQDRRYSRWVENISRRRRSSASVRISNGTSILFLQMEKTVEINENSKFLEDLEMLTAVPSEQLHSSVDETSPDHSQDGLGTFKFGGSNPLEQLGLYMKMDDDEEECELATLQSDDPIDVEEGEID